MSTSTRFESAMELADYYDTPRIRIFSFYMPPGDDPGVHRALVLNRMSELAAKRRRGITLILENEKGIYGDTAPRVADVLDSVGSPFLIHAFDPANYLEVGQSIDEAWSLLRPHVKHFHVKDYDTKTHRNVPAGAGDGQIPRLLADAAATATMASASSSRTWSSRRSRSALPGRSGLATRRWRSRRFSAKLRSCLGEHGQHKPHACTGPSRPRARYRPLHDRALARSAVDCKGLARSFR